MTISDLKELAQAGGLTVFAVAIWWELRQWRPEIGGALKELREELAELRGELLGSARRAASRRAPTNPVG